MELTEDEITDLCMKARAVFMSQPMLLQLSPPVKICGTRVDTRLDPCDPCVGAEGG